MHKDTKWAKGIIALQEKDGKWGWFHSLSQFYNSHVTTEQALRRLLYLGYTIEDDCIKKAVSYMDDCLTGRLIDFVNFYPVSLLAGCLDEKTEAAFLEYILNNETGIYYIYDSKVYTLPGVFESKKASLFLGAAELLSKYKTGKIKLRFVVDWLESNKNSYGRWDMGNTVNDKVYFPLSDNWRKKETREDDCTERITNLIKALSPA